MQARRKPEEITEDFIAAAQWLQRHPGCDGKVGVVGFCFGGLMANTLAVRLPEIISAAVPFYGRQPAAADAPKIKASLLLHYAELDQRVNEGWPADEAALKSAGIRYTAHIYPAVNHGFHNDTTPRYDEAAAKLAWSRTVDFFKKGKTRIASSSLVTRSTAPFVWRATSGADTLRGDSSQQDDRHHRLEATAVPPAVEYLEPSVILLLGDPSYFHCKTNMRLSIEPRSPSIPVSRSGPAEAFIRAMILAVFALSFVGLPQVRAAQPYTQATVTRLENNVSYGKQQGGQSVTRPAAVQDTIKANSFLLSERKSRAELKYLDGTIVRVGENTVFSFEANSRTLALSKGMFFFYVPQGKGGGIIKTPSLAVAITGTVGKVTTNMIVILEGSVRLIPSRRTVVAGQFARKNPDGSITIDYFDKARAPRGVVSADGAKIRKGLEREVLDLVKHQSSGSKESEKTEEKKSAKAAPAAAAKHTSVIAKEAAKEAAKHAARTAAQTATRTATMNAAAQAAAAASKAASKEASKKAAKPSAPHYMH